MVTRGLDPRARASATSVTVRQKAQTPAVNYRPEKIVAIGNYTNSNVTPGKLILASNNSDDAGIIFGFGSPLHRQAKKLFPADRNGAKCEVYYLPVAQPQGGVAHALNINVSGKATRNLVGYMRYTELEFEAAADVAGKVATNAQLDPARAPRRLILDIFNKVAIPFTIKKGDDAAAIYQTLQNAIDNDVAAPFTQSATKDTPEAAVISSSAAANATNLTATDYVIVVNVNGANHQFEIGEIDAATAQDVIEAVNAVIEDAGIILTATTASAVTTTYKLSTTATGANASLQILTPTAEGTDLFAALNIGGSASGSDENALKLTAKFAGSTSAFEVDFVDSNGDAIADAGVNFAVGTISEGAGLVDITKTLGAITSNYGITRVVSQFGDNLALNALHDYFIGFRTDGLIAQCVLAYTSKAFPENPILPGTVDVQALKKWGDDRRQDSINIAILGDYGDLRALEYEKRDLMLKAGISNLEKRIEGGWRIGDLVTFYHPQNVEDNKPLYLFDRDVTLIGNVLYYIRNHFDNSEQWRSIILVGDNDVTTNPNARSPKQICAAYNALIGNMGIAAWIADYENAQKRTVVQIDPNNSDRVDIAPDFELTGVGNIFDIVNSIGFYFGQQV